MVNHCFCSCRSCLRRAFSSSRRCSCFAAAGRTVYCYVAAKQCHVAVALQAAAAGSLGAAVACIGGSVAAEGYVVGAAIDGQRAVGRDAS